MTHFKLLLVRTHLLAAALSLALLMCSIGVSAQGYENITESSGIDAWCDGLFGNGSSVYDFDNDGWDDITLASSVNGLKFYRNMGDGTFESLDLGISFFGDPKSIIWVDYDNDSDNDLLISGFSNVRLYKNEGDLVLTDVTADVGIDNGLAKSAGSSFGDVNNDGWLDLYICRYEQVNNSFKNILYISDQAGNFIDETTVWGVENGFQPSFQSTFFDADRDGDQDLFIINDRDTFTNTFYRNDGGYFTDVSGFYNIDYDMWSMSNTVDDFNNDGYPDIYVTNTITGNALFMNEGADGIEGFVDETESYNVSVDAFCWASAFSDYDNNGWKDLWVLSEPYIFGEGDHYLYTNTGDSCEIFATSGAEESIGRSFSLGMGDLNNDGFQDVVTHSMSDLGTEVWQNLGIGGSYLGIDLKGSISNSPAIGSYIDVYSSNGLSTAYVMCGENYLGQNSAVEHFGLGAAEIVDSILVYWPSGHVDRWMDVPVNETYVFAEGTSLSVQITASSTHLCPGDSLVLDAGTWDQYSWSTGDTTAAITVTQTGVYTVTTWTDLGLTYLSPALTISDAPSPDLNPSVQAISCYGESNGSIDMQPDSTQIDSIIWSNGNTGLLLNDLPEGNYGYLYIDTYGCWHADSILIEAPDELLIFYSTVNPTCFDSEDGLLIIDSIQGGNGDYSYDYEDFDPSAMGDGEYSFSISDSLNCTWQSGFELISPEELTATDNIIEGTLAGTQTIELNVLGGTTPYTYLWTPSGSESADLTDVIPGEYSVLITDSLGCISELSITLTSIAENSGSTLLIFPNPASSDITIAGTESFGRIFIYNTMGQLVLDIDNYQHTANISANIEKLALGPYCIRTSDGQIIARFVKE